MDEPRLTSYKSVTPCFYDEDKKRNYKSSFHAKISDFSQDFLTERSFGRDIGVYDDSERKKAFNKTTTELIKREQMERTR